MPVRPSNVQVDGVVIRAVLTRMPEKKMSPKFEFPNSGALLQFQFLWAPLGSWPHGPPAAFPQPARAFLPLSGTPSEGEGGPPATTWLWHSLPDSTLLQADEASSSSSPAAPVPATANR